MQNSTSQTRRAHTSASPSNPLQIYLGDINEIPLLKAEEEAALAQRIAAGDPHAREHMVRANLRLVVIIARGYLGKGLALEDLIEEGNLGLLRAVEGYDHTMQTRFSTYASYWIKQSIRRAIMNSGKVIRLPVYMISLLSKWKRVTVVLADRLGREPSFEEVGKALRVPKKRLAIVQKAIGVNGLISVSVTHEWQLKEQDADPYAAIVDERTKSAEEMVTEDEEMDRVFVGLDGLDDREQDVIKMRFGLAGYQPMTLREIGERLGLTRERVRQLEDQALGKLMSSIGQGPVSGGGRPKFQRTTPPKSEGSMSTDIDASPHLALGATPSKTSRVATKAACAAAGSKRRRRIDPATCDRPQTEREQEFGSAMIGLRNRLGTHLSSADMLQVAKSLGYFSSDLPNYGERHSPGPSELARFESALADYKRMAKRPFPTWSEVLEVLESLGYCKLASDSPNPGSEMEEASELGPFETSLPELESDPALDELFERVNVDELEVGARRLN